MTPYEGCSCLSLEQDFLDPVKSQDEVILLIPLDDLEDGVEEIIEIYEEIGDNDEEDGEDEEEEETDGIEHEE